MDPAYRYRAQVVSNVAPIIAVCVASRHVNGPATPAGCAKHTGDDLRTTERFVLNNQFANGQTHRDCQPSVRSKTATATRLLMAIATRTIDGGASTAIRRQASRLRRHTARVTSLRTATAASTAKDVRFESIEQSWRMYSGGPCITMRLSTTRTAYEMTTVPRTLNCGSRVTHLGSGWRRLLSGRS